MGAWVSSFFSPPSPPPPPPPSPPPPSSSSQEKYDVFLSFRGPDTRYNITSHIHAALCREKILAFIDDDLRGGDEISDALLRAIEGSKVSIIIFSINYATSKWCLNELVKIIELKRKNQQIVLPLFYNVDPCDVRHQRGSFAQALARHHRLRFEKIQKWREALTEAANLSGWDSQVIRPEARLIEKIVEDVSSILAKLYSVPSDDDSVGQFGISSRIQQLEILSSNDSKQVKIVGLWGMGGIGKTTLALAFFKQVCNRFEGHCFLESVQEKSQKLGLNNLRKEVLNQILKKGNNLHIGDLELPHMRNRLCRTKVLIVLDDVNDSVQIEVLVGGTNSFGPGSVVLVTSRDKQVLINGGCQIYEVQKLGHQEALGLFSHHAFREKLPTSDRIQLSDGILNYANGNPLALKTLGAFLYGRSKEEQESALNKLQRTPNPKIQKVLQISYEGLDYEEQNIFLHIACFFKGEGIYDVRSILNGCGFSTDIGIRVLVDKTLVTIRADKTLWMHDLLQKMGREIVCQQSIEEPGKRSRLWDYCDIYSMLTMNKGTAEVKGLFLCASGMRTLNLSPTAFANMSNLQILKIQNTLRKDICSVYLPDGLELLPDELRYLYWSGYPWKSLPLNFHPENLVMLEMPFSQVEQLWIGTQNLVKLKKMDFSSSCKLVELPNLSQTPNIEILNLSGCESLIELPSSIQHLHKLTFLKLRDCKRLKNLPSIICNLKSLAYLNLIGCSSITNFPDVPTSIIWLYLENTSIEEVPSSIEYLTSLVDLSLEWCQRLKNLPGNIRNLQRLQVLSLLGCSSISIFPEVSINIKRLDLCGTAIKEIPSAIQYLTSLENLRLDGCTISGNHGRRVCNFQSITELPDNLGCLSSFEAIELSGSNFQNIPATIKHLIELTRLALPCSNSRLQSLSQLPMSIDLLKENDCTSLALMSVPFPKFRGQFSANDQPYGLVNFSNCLELDQNACNVVVENEELKLAHIQTVLGPEKISQVSLGSIICYRGSQIPESFNCKSMGSLITVKLPLHWDNPKFLCFGLCISFESNESKGFPIDVLSMNHKCTFRYNNGDSLDCYGGWGSLVGRLPKYGINHVLLKYVPPCKEIQQKNKEYGVDANEMSVEFSTEYKKCDGTTCTIKMCAVRLIYIPDSEDRWKSHGRSRSSEELEDEPGPKRLKLADPAPEEVP